MTLSLIGKRIGNYDIQTKIGEGGMGMVYLGLHPQIGKRVAIKVLHEELSSKADVVGRFFNEARSVNDINHPNIVDIVDFGDITLEGVVFKYIIMEFLDGESLASRIRREGVTIRETLQIIAQCASALAASHGKGVVHRDLKPENIFLCPRGPDRNYVKLLDFGIAKLTGDGGAAMSSRTRTGMVIGTPAYMSPEQCEGRGQIDHRSDIYALGVVMYELLTGRVPFPGDGFGEVLVAHLTREPEAPTQLNQNIPAEIEAIVLHCLKKDRGQRFQSMQDMFGALQDPASHFQMWAHSAQLPPGAMVANAMMSTVFSNPQTPAAPGGPSGAPGAIVQARATGPIPWPQQAGPLASGAVAVSPGLAGPLGTGAVAALPAGLGGVGTGPMPQASGPIGAPGATIALDTPVVSGQPRVVTGMAMRPPGIGSSSALPAVQGPRPTTLSGASGEATSGGRRPTPVMLGFVGAIVLGAVAGVGIKGLRHDVPVAVAGPVKKGPDKKAPAGPGPGPSVAHPVQQPAQPVVQQPAQDPAVPAPRQGTPEGDIQATPGKEVVTTPSGDEAQGERKHGGHRHHGTGTSGGSRHHKQDKTNDGGNELLKPIF